MRGDILSRKPSLGPRGLGLGSRAQGSGSQGSTESRAASPSAAVRAGTSHPGLPGRCRW